MLRIVLAVVVGAAVVAVTVRLFIVPVSVVAAKVCAMILPGSVSEEGYYFASDLAMDAGLALPGVVVAVLIARRRGYPRGCCRACGYDLTGNVSGRCPECGHRHNRVDLRLKQEANDETEPGARTTGGGHRCGWCWLKSGIET